MQGDEPEDYRMHGQHEDEEDYFLIFCFFVITLADIILEITSMISFDMPLTITHIQKYHMGFV